MVAVSPPDVPPDATDGHPLIVFDGMCVLCSANARFVLRHDRRGHFRLTTAQGPLGESLYRRFGLSTENYETMLVVDQGRLLTESDAVLAIVRGLGWPWRAAAAAAIVPRAVRNRLYRLIARNRFRLFGRRETCWMPSATDAGRIV